MNFLCFDTEDNSRELMEAGRSGFEKKVTQIAAITADGAKYYNKGDRLGFLKWVRRQPNKFIYAHNLQYDLGNLFADDLDSLDVTLVAGRIIRAVWGDKVFLDSFNIWPMSAKKIGAAFGIEKLETESMAADKAYVFRDVEIILAAMRFAWQFCFNNGLEQCPPTLGGLCVKIWKAWGGENCHDSHALSRQALFGGRVELYKVVNETENVGWTDINSLYPSVMLNAFPGPLEELGTKLAKWGIASVTVKVPKTDLPVLPFRNEAGRILYPYGRFSGTWTLAELQYAESQGTKIETVHECMGTNETIRPYGTFVDRLYKMRRASESEAEKLFFKLLMNNLYGRLGASGEIGRSVWQNERNKNDGQPYGDKVLVNYKMPLAEETNWSHAAYVTSYGRIELHKHMKLIGTDSMIYCDTDSTIFDSPDKTIPFDVGPALGQMKLESWEKSCQTYAPKLYTVGKFNKAKGVPQRLAKVFIETGKASFDLPFKIREAIRFYDRDNIRQLSVWRNVTKQRRNFYDRKRLIGNRYFPCKINAPLVF